MKYIENLKKEINLGLRELVESVGKTKEINGLVYPVDIINISDFLKANKKILDVEYQETTVYCHSKTNYYRIIIPHEGNNFHWLFQRAKRKGFDRWANSVDESNLYKTIPELFRRLKKI